MLSNRKGYEENNIILVMPFIDQPQELPHSQQIIKSIYSILNCDFNNFNF